MKVATLLPLAGLCVGCSQSNSPPATSRAKLESVTQIRRLSGAYADDFFGVSVAGGRDADGDGVPDQLIGAFNYLEALPWVQIFSLARTRTPYVKLISGKTGKDLHTLKNPAPGFGAAVALVADTDGDGCADILVGAPSFELLSMILSEKKIRSSGPRSAFLYSGKSGRLIRTLTSDDDPVFGYSVAQVGDADADGVLDLAVGSPGSLERAGHVRVFSGKSGLELFKVYGEPGESFGASIATLGDITGDGLAELVVGAYKAPNRDLRECGLIRIYDGKNGVLLRTLRGEVAFAKIGIAVSGIGDVDGDGIEDLAIGASGSDDNGPFTGSMSIYSAATGKVIHRVVGDLKNSSYGKSITSFGGTTDSKPAYVAVSSDYGEPGETRVGRVWIYETASWRCVSREVHGTVVARAGDVNGDGVQDLLVGDPSSEASQPGAGLLLSGTLPKK